MKNRAHSPATAGATGSDDVHTITDANAAHSDEMRGRMIKYAVAMGIRLVCFAMLFVLDGWLKVIAIAGAVFLPWVAVVIANGGSDTVNEHAGSLLDQAPLTELEQPGKPDDGGEPPERVVLQGEIISDDEARDGRPATGGARPGPGDGQSGDGQSSGDEPGSGAERSA